MEVIIVVDADAVRSFASGLFILTGFGALWMILGARLLWGWNWRPLLVIALITLILGFSAQKVWTAAKHFANAAPGGASPGFPGVNYGMVTTLEFALIFALAFALRRLGRPDLIFQVVALVVGLHFIPLAAIFHGPIYYGTAAAIILASLGAFVFHDPALRQGVACMGCGASLWLTSAVMLRMSGIS